ncbi:MAG: NUDIX hydrolase [Lachnospiraceae bacterium]|jgi:mutator protein MutT|nr:NUDIX hydrolase [Lachnospiraceae bacterium]
METELYELVDENGNKTGKVITEKENRNVVFPVNYFMPIVGVVIINNENKILLQKRSKLKTHNPGVWGVCGGKVNFKETPEDAIIRETREEIGIDLNGKNLKLLTQMADENVIGDKGFFTTFYINQNVDLDKCVIQKEEVDEVKYFTIDEIEKIDCEKLEWLEELKKLLGK